MTKKAFRMHDLFRMRPTHNILKDARPPFDPFRTMLPRLVSKKTLGES